MPVKIKSQSVFASYFIISGINAGELEEKTFKESYILYDENGRATEQAKILPSGVVESLIKNRYDSNGNKVEETLFVSEDEVSERKTYEYNDKQLPEAQLLHYIDGSCDKTIFIYDERDNPVEKKTFDDENQLESRVEYRYENGLLSETVFYDSEGIPVEKEKYIRDSKGKVTEAIIENKDNITEKHLNQYNEEGHLIKSVRHSGSDNAEIIYLPGEDGKISEETIFSKGKMVRKSVFLYDENNFLTEIREVVLVPGFSSEQTTTKKIEYEYY